MIPEQLAAHRPELLRHCYRMLGSFADAEDIVQDVLESAIKARESYTGAAPLQHWLMRIATNACLNELAKRKRRKLPQLEGEAASGLEHVDLLEANEWLTPALDERLFPQEQTLELRESVALAFLALLQRLPPRQRAALLLKDVLGWSAEEIAATLDTTTSSVSSALHRARETITLPPRLPSDPPADVLREYVRSWEEHDLDALVRLLHDDVVFAMPPYATWYRGANVGAFFRGERLAAFWAKLTRVVVTRANGQLALAFYADERPHSLQLVEFTDGRVTLAIQFIGADALKGFAIAT